MNSFIKKIVSIGIIPYVIWLIFSYHYHFIDGANLLFHEAGHMVLSFSGETIHFLGGSIGQLVFPAICFVSFLRRGQKFESAICGIWFGENVINIAWYLGDAQAQGIPLVGGGIHDWNWLLSKAGLLSECRLISTVVHVLGAMILISAVIFLFYESFFCEKKVQ
ncbi:MAG: hypothetical protein GY853_11950 [PVC group bacterium]|nr:hypothetical protein [PVC group bacterium]